MRGWILEHARGEVPAQFGDTTPILAKLHQKLVDDAPWAWIVHNRNPIAFSPKVKCYTPVQSWFTDLTMITVEK